MSEKEKIAISAANICCRCFKCDGIVRDTNTDCDKERLLTCHQWYDGYRTSLLALGEYEKQFQEPASDGLEKEIIKAEIERRILDWRMGMSAEAKYRLEAYTELLEVVNTMPKEPVSEELETSIMEYMNHVPENEPELSTTLYTYEQMQAIARYFANWQTRYKNGKLESCE